MNNFITKSVTLEHSPAQVREILVNPAYNTIRLEPFAAQLSMVFEPREGAPLQCVMEWKGIVSGSVTEVTPNELLEIRLNDEKTGEPSDYRERYEIVAQPDGTSVLNITGGSYYRPGREELYAMHEKMRDEALESMKHIVVK